MGTPLKLRAFSNQQPRYPRILGFEKDVRDLGFQAAWLKSGLNQNDFQYIAEVESELIAAFADYSNEKLKLRLEIWWTAGPEVLFA